MNATGTEMDITVFLHECGHAFHFLENMEVYKYFFENLLPVEFSEIPSTAMEYLAIPYLGKAEGGYLATVTLSRYVHQKIENAMYRWCYIAIGDAFQHWVYTHPEEACDATACDQQWRLLNARFMPWVDSSGVEEESAMQWMLQLHFFKLPFYFIEYGLSQLAAIQIWQQSLIDPQRAISQYIDGLAFTNQKTLPDLFATAGAKLAFDAETLAEAVLFLEQQYSRFEI
jgi:oligoendopeptidase F